MSSAGILVQGDHVEVVDARLVPGADHSSYRGEAFAVTWPGNNIRAFISFWIALHLLCC